MSDCFVVSGAVGWGPSISPTYIMAMTPQNNGNSQCKGGDPAGVIKYLEDKGVADYSCVDYSWCSGSKLCTSLPSEQHFNAKDFASQLNAKIPPAACYFGGIKRWMYKLDKGSDVFYINEKSPIEVFRNTVRSHILDYGPIIGGYVVLANFMTGNFTDPNLNGGVYFERADYNNYRRGDTLKFSDEMTKDTSGLHAVSIVGFGIARNILYDTDKRGDVPYWHCRNSWGTNWGNENGYFKIAMYPYNKTAQFDKQVVTKLGKIGGVILIRATKRPTQTTLPQMDEKFLNEIKRQKPDSFYKLDADNFRVKKRERLPDDLFFPSGLAVVSSSFTLTNVQIALLLVVLVLFVILILRRK